MNKIQKRLGKEIAKQGIVLPLPPFHKAHDYQSCATLTKNCYTNNNSGVYLIEEQLTQDELLISEGLPCLDITPRGCLE